MSYTFQSLYLWSNIILEVCTFYINTKYMYTEEGVLYLEVRDFIWVFVFYFHFYNKTGRELERGKTGKRCDVDRNVSNPRPQTDGLKRRISEEVVQYVNLKNW